MGRYVRDPSIPRWRRFAVLGAVLYLVMPVDLIPDVVPVLGWLDDVGILGAALAFFARDVARFERVQAIDARAREVVADGPRLRG